MRQNDGGLRAGFTWWVAGIPWDITHGVGNFVLMLVLYRPVRGAMRRLSLGIAGMGGKTGRDLPAGH